MLTSLAAAKYLFDPHLLSDPRMPLGSIDDALAQPSDSRTIPGTLVGYKALAVIVLGLVTEPFVFLLSLFVLWIVAELHRSPLLYLLVRRRPSI